MINELPPFPGFQPAAFAFLRDLAANNARDWFKPRKSIYDDEIVWPMHCLLAEVAREAAARGIPLTAEPKKALFRIYRDTRFSKNKDPYKTSAGAVLSRDGTTKSFGGLYIHLQPGECFLAAGFWHPDNDRLRAWRTYMAAHPAEFLEMKQRLAAAGLELDHYDDALKRLPRGFEDHAGSDIEPYLKWKSFTASRRVDDRALQTPAFAGDVVQFMEDSYPLLRYGWETAGQT